MIFFLILQTASSQCLNVWNKISTWPEELDTLSSLPIPLNKPFPDFDSIYNLVFPVLEDSSQFKSILKKIDSLYANKNKADSADAFFLLQTEIWHIPFIKIDNYEVGVFESDTILYQNKKIQFVHFSTNFSSEWNPDFSAWELYYVKEFGIIFFHYTTDWAETETIAAPDAWVLKNNCRVTNENREELEFLINKIVAQTHY